MAYTYDKLTWSKLPRYTCTPASRRHAPREQNKSFYLILQVVGIFSSTPSQALARFKQREKQMQNTYSSPFLDSHIDHPISPIQNAPPSASGQK